MQLKRLLGHFFPTVVARNVRVFGATSDKRAIRVLILLVLGAPVYLLLPLGGTGVYLGAKLLVLLAQPRDQVARLLQRLLQLTVFVLQKGQAIVIELLGGGQAAQVSCLGRHAILRREGRAHGVQRL